MKSRSKVQFVIECADCERLAGEWRDNAITAREDAETLGWEEYEYARMWRCPECVVKFEERVDHIYVNVRHAVIDRRRAQMDLLYDIKNIHQDHEGREDFLDD